MSIFTVPGKAYVRDLAGHAAEHAAMGVSFSTKYPMQKTQRMMARVRAGVAHGNIAMVGDSTTAGQYANGLSANVGMGGARALSTPAALAANLVAAGINVNFGALHADSGAISIGTTLPIYDTRCVSGSNFVGGGVGTAGGNSLYIPSTTALAGGAPDTFTLTPADSFDTVDVYWLRLSTCGTFTIDCGGAVLATCSAGASSVQKTTVSKTAGTGVINIIRTATGSGGIGIYVAAIVPYLTTKKCVNILPMGYCGSTTQGWVSGSQPISPKQMLNEFSQDLTIIELGLNDANSALTYAQTYANLALLIAEGQSVGDVLLVIPHNVGVAYSANLPEQVRAIQDVADAYSCNVLNVASRWGTYANANTLGYMYSDMVHPLQIAYNDKASMLSRFLLSL